MPSLPAARRPRIRLRRVLFVVLLAILATQVAWYGRIGLIWFAQIHRATPVFDPPVLAGQGIPFCSGGVYARAGDGRLVLTTTGHCLSEGEAVRTGDGRDLGTASAPSRWAALCDRPGKNRCTASDMAVIYLAPAMIPWGHLNWVDLGAGGYRVIAPGTAALSCDQVAAGDPVEFDGRSLFRTGVVIEKGSNDFPQDGTYIPCIVATNISAAGGDSGGVVLVRGVPAGVAARVFGADNDLAFSPLAEGLAELGLTLCDTPDCGLVPPAYGAPSQVP